MLNMVQQKSPAPTVSTCNTNSTIGKNTFDPDHNQAWIIYKGATNHIVSTLDMIMEGCVSKHSKVKPMYLSNGTVT